MKSVFTTGEASRICNVAPSTVAKWFDRGELQGYRVPGSQHRRIPRHDLVQFLRAHGMPLGELNRSKNLGLLLISEDDTLEQGFRAVPEVELRRVASWFTAGLENDLAGVDVFIFDLALPALEDNCRSVREWSHQSILLGISPPGCRGPWPVELDEVLERPFDPALLARRAARLVAARS